MEINAISSVGSAASQEHLGGLASVETNKGKLSTAQEKAPSSPNSIDVNISSTGAELSVRAEASEESNTENDSENNQEANKTADAARVQNQNSAEEEFFSPEERINKLNTAAQETPGAVYSAQANVSENTAEALIA